MFMSLLPPLTLYRPLRTVEYWKKDVAEFGHSRTQETTSNVITGASEETGPAAEGLKNGPVSREVTEFSAHQEPTWGGQHLFITLNRHNMNQKVFCNRRCVKESRVHHQLTSRSQSVSRTSPMWNLDKHRKSVSEERCCLARKYTLTPFIRLFLHNS